MATSQSTDASASKSSGKSSLRMLAVMDMANLLRHIFEYEREMIRTATTLVYRVGEPELKYLLCQHIWESAQHARFLRERGREMAGFGSGESVRTEIRKIFEEAVKPEDGMIALAGFYRVLKPALLKSYRYYLKETDHLADWPSKQLLQEFIADEERHASEMEKYLEGVEAGEWVSHMKTALSSIGGLLEIEEKEDLPAGFVWKHEKEGYSHPPVCSRGKYPVCSSVFGHNPDEDPIIRPWLEEEANTDAAVLRLMIYVWLMMEMDAVDYLATIFYDTPEAPLDMHYDMARHLWDESRHSQFGFRQLPRLGVDVMTVEHSLDLYCILVQMPAPERYAMMTMEFEAGSFPTKAYLIDRIRELNDFEVDTLLAFDRNDEQNHVRYGHQWLKPLMEQFGIEAEVGDFVKATQKKFEEFAEKFGGKIPHSLSPEERLTGNKIKKIAGVN